VATSTITTVAGTGTAGFNGDNQPATAAQVNIPGDVAVDGVGNLLIADRFNNRIRRVDVQTGMITTVAGTGVAGFNGDNQPATAAQLSDPFGVTVDQAGNLLIADHNNHRIRRVDVQTGMITTVAGTGVAGFNGDNQPATAALLSEPFSVAVDQAGSLLIVDGRNMRIRRVDVQTGMITTVAGTGLDAFNGDNQLATVAQLGPVDVAVDGAGNVLISDVRNMRIRRVDARTGIITTVAGTGGRGFNGDNQPATSAQLNFPAGIAVDGAGNLLIADQTNARIRRVDIQTGMITTVAGTGTAGFNGDNQPATSAELNMPSGIAIDGAGNLLIADSFNQRVRRVGR
jgi:adhesin/invasin